MRFRIALLSSLMVVAACHDYVNTPLRTAAADGDLQEVTRLLAGGADPDGKEKPGWTPLGLAARKGHLEVVRALLKAGAEVDRRDSVRNRWTPLIHAIHKNQNQAARALLDGGAKVDERVGCGATALMFAAAYGNTEIVRELLARGADPYLEAKGGVTALSNAAGGGALFDFTDGPSFGTCFPDTIRALKDRAPDLTLKDTLFNRAALWLGRSQGCRDAVALLKRS